MSWLKSILLNIACPFFYFKLPVTLPQASLMKVCIRVGLHLAYNLRNGARMGRTAYLPRPSPSP